jgi:hypothetical protein
LILVGGQLLYAALHYSKIKRHRLKLPLQLCRNCRGAGRGTGNNRQVMEPKPSRNTPSSQAGHRSEDFSLNRTKGGSCAATT